MKRREFLARAATAALTPMLAGPRAFGEQASPAACCARTYASPREAMQSPRETLAYLPAIYVGAGVDKPDYLATVDLDPTSANYGRVIHRLELPYVGDELHHFGWNACSSCHGDATSSRRFSLVDVGIGSPSDVLRRVVRGLSNGFVRLNLGPGQFEQNRGGGARHSAKIS